MTCARSASFQARPSLTLTDVASQWQHTGVGSLSARYVAFPPLVPGSGMLSSIEVGDQSTNAGRKSPGCVNTPALDAPTALKTESTLELPSCGRLRRAPAAWNLGHAARRASYVLHRTRPAAHCRNVAVALPAVLSYPWACRSACDCIPSFDCPLPVASPSLCSWTIAVFHPRGFGSRSPSASSSRGVRSYHHSSRGSATYVPVTG